MVDYIAFVLLIVFSYLGFLLGKRIARLKKIFWVLCTSFCIASIIFYILVNYYPAVEFKLIPTFLAAFYEILNFIPSAMILIGIGFERVTERNKRALKLFGIFVFIVALFQTSCIFVGHTVREEEFRINEEGVCIQSTGYTCGAASAVTLLRHYEIYATELEMAKLSRTRPALGVRMASLARAIGEKVREKNLSVELFKTNWETLKNLRKPCIVDVDWALFVSHVIVLLETGDSKVKIADPLSGVVYWDKKRFLDKWLGSVIIVK